MNLLAWKYLTGLSEEDSTRQIHLLSKRNVSKRLAFARTHKDNPINFWKNVLWSDERKINRIGPDGRTFVRRPRCQEYNPRRW